MILSSPIRILIIEDSEDDTILLIHELKQSGYDVIFEQVDNYNDMKNSLKNREWDIVFCDYSMPKFDGISALRFLQKEGYELPFILISGTIGEDVAVEAMKAGADDYIMKDNLSRLATAVKRELNEYSKRKELKRMEKAIQTLVKSTVVKTGEDALRNIISSVAEWLNTDLVSLGQIIGDNNIKTLSMFNKADFKCDCISNIKGTLCENVLNEGIYYYPEGAGNLLPEPCKELTKIDAKGFFGMSIRDENGKSIGLLWTASSSKLNLPPRTMEVMEIITAKAASEIKRKWAEDQLILQNEKLEILVKERTHQIIELERKRIDDEKLAAMGRMAASIAHEINNPLSSIKGGYMLIKDFIPKDIKYYDYVDIIEKELDRIARIVRQMFDLSKPNQGEISNFDAMLVIRDVITMLGKLSNENSVFISFIGHSHTAEVTMSEDYLRQILYNLIKNGIEASSQGSRVEVEAGVDDHKLNIIVSDMGKGMTNKVRSKIFEPFFSTKSKYSNSGMGIGLTTTKVIVESMGGSIDCNSKNGKGTAFTVNLPINLIK